MRTTSPFLRLLFAFGVVPVVLPLACSRGDSPKVLTLNTSASALTAPRWDVAPPMNVSRNRHTATRLSDGRLLAVGGGSNTAEVYDPATNGWTLVASMSTARTTHSATLLPNGKVLVAGGPSEVVEVYDPVTNTWTATTPMLTPRYGHTATLLPDGRIYMLGGVVDGDGVTYEAEIYDPATTPPSM